MYVYPQYIINNIIDIRRPTVRSLFELLNRYSLIFDFQLAGW